jgi:hypothetical protein
MYDIDNITNEQLNAEIAKLIGWKKIKKIKDSNTYTGINPETQLKCNIPNFAQCPNAVNIAETYVAQQIGMSYLLYLGKYNETPNNPASWNSIQKALLEPLTRAKTCLKILQDIHNDKIPTTQLIK